MRLLIVDVNHEHPNTMHRNFYKALSEVMEVEYFGPGFTDEYVLSQGLKAFLEAKQHYDVIMVTWAFVLDCIDFDNPRAIYHFHRYDISKYKVGMAIRYNYMILRELLEYKESKKAIVYYHDVVNMPDEWYGKIRSILKNDFYLLTAASEFISKRNNENKKIFGLPMTNNMIKLDEQFHHKIISVPVQAATADELEYRILEEREYDWIIPGSLETGSYPKRKKVYDRISKAGYTVWDEAIDREMAYKKTRRARKNFCNYYSEVDRFINTYLLDVPNVYINNKVKVEELGIFHENYRDGLRKARIAYADGGLGKSIVRKYMEIPAAGTVLMCDNIIGIDKLGFKDRINAVFVNEQNVVRKTQKLFSDKGYIQEIANAGRKLIIDKHMVRHRAQAVKSAFKSILAESYKGSHWENGDFYIDEC
ncbi:hypothetical protein IMSAGC019_00259 [Lachnospiraceae bacterium]|nr:hypothetical protein IMSAGC019_00259 [Lachnospiraceae bacterium]